MESMQRKILVNTKGEKNRKEDLELGELLTTVTKRIMKAL